MSRINNLITKCGIKDRIIPRCGLKPEVYSSVHCPHWEEVDNNLREEIDVSLNYLNRVLGIT